MKSFPAIQQRILLWGSVLAAGFLVALWCGGRVSAQNGTGTFITFSVPWSFNTYPYAINNGNMITGYFVGADAKIHGFVREAWFGFITTFDPPESINTWAFDINDFGAITGFYATANGALHGFLRNQQGTITSFDPPGSTKTHVIRINSSGFVTGWYEDASNVTHGFVQSGRDDHFVRSSREHRHPCLRHQRSRNHRWILPDSRRSGPRLCARALVWNDRAV